MLFLKIDFITNKVSSKSTKFVTQDVMQVFLQKLINNSVLCIILMLCFSINAQVILFQDIFKGGVTASGTSFGVSSSYFESNIQVNINPTSTIRKAFIICYENINKSENGVSKNILIYFNNSPLKLNETTKITEYNISHASGQFSSSITHQLDVTNLIATNQNVYPIQIPEQNYLHDSKYHCFYLIVLYENEIFSTINFSLILNNQNLILNTSEYLIENINPILFDKDIGLAIQSDILWDTNIDKTKVLINDNLIGEIKGSDMNNQQYTGAGVKGSFYYENNFLFGLDDDIANNVMNESDGIAIINEYLNSNSTFEIKLITNSSINIFNNYISFPLAYSTPCDTFSFTLTPDTTICRGETLQLSTSGGQAYEWKAANPSALMYLSCTDCANPIFSGDSSTLYTVQIWNNDSCSVVRPIKINVRDRPQFSSVNLSASTCGLEDGKLVAVATNSNVLPISYSLNNGNFQLSSTFTGNFANLASGSYIVKLKDGNGCISDTTVVIGVQNQTEALFTVNPSTGAAPLNLSISNNSVFAANYSWFLNDISQGSTFSNFVADTSGLYAIELIAWQHDVNCADTFAITISVYDTVFLQIPNIFTPNNDATNDVFGITSNLPLEINYEIYNRWGNLMHSGTSRTSDPNSIIIDLGNGQSFYQLWDGTALPSSASATSVNAGVYFYKLELNVIKELLLPSIDLGQQKLEFPLKKEGWVQLVRD